VADGPDAALNVWFAKQQENRCSIGAGGAVSLGKTPRGEEKKRGWEGTGPFVWRNPPTRQSSQFRTRTVKWTCPLFVPRPDASPSSDLGKWSNNQYDLLPERVEVTLIMSFKKDIPDMAICHKCGEPMQVVDLVSQAEQLGFGLPEGAFVVECCGTELTVDDDDLAIRIRGLLLEYHRQHRNDADKL
jgi:hypothetical protein